MTNNDTDGLIERDKSLEMAYKVACDFEKTHYEKIYEHQDGSIILEIDKDIYNNIDDSIENTLDEPIKYPSYRDLFNKRYRNSFRRNLNAINIKLIEKELGINNLQQITRLDDVLEKQYLESIKERDLDNDGVPDRIDIDDTKNSVQSIKDLDIVKNSTSADTERYNENKDRENQQKRKYNQDLER